MSGEFIFNNSDGVSFYEACVTLTVSEWEQIVNYRIPYIKEKVAAGVSGCQQSAEVLNAICQYTNHVQSNYCFALPLLNNFFESLKKYEQFEEKILGLEREE